MLAWSALLLALAQGIPCPNNGNFNRTGTVLQLNGIWKEISGVSVSSQTFNGEQVAWVHDDSGGQAALGLFSTVSGLLVQRFNLPNNAEVPFQDPEDIAVGPCGASWPFPGTGDCIYLADMGDNSRVRTNLRIYKMREPVLATLTAGATSSFQFAEMQVLRLHYDVANGAPTANSDCESLFVDPVGQEPGEEKGDLYVVTKWMAAADYGKSRLFRYPNAMQDGTTDVALELASNATSLRTATWTRADMSRDGSLVVVGSYVSTNFWHRGANTTIAAMFEASGVCLDYGYSVPVMPQLQQEASGFTPTAPFALLEIGECFGTCNATLHRTPLAAPPSTAPTSPAPTSPSAGPAISDSSQCCPYWVPLPLLALFSYVF